MTDRFSIEHSNQTNTKVLRSKPRWTITTIKSCIDLYDMLKRGNIFLLAGAIFISLLFSTCAKEEVLESTDYLSDKSFEKGLKVDGHVFDSLIIENCTFTGGPLILGDCDHVLIRNCSFKDIDNNAIKIGFTGPCSHITIENCEFEGIGFNAIDSHEDAPHCVIRNCTFADIARSHVGIAMAQPHHCIYWKAPDVLIEGCRFDCSDQPNGNAISIRSSGVLRKNVIHNSPKNGIMYFSDHPGGDSLLVENNFITGSAFSGFRMASSGTANWHNSHVVVRFNSMALNDANAIDVAAAFESTTTVNIYGNVLVTSNGKHIDAPFDITASHNLKSTGDVGFVDMVSGDLHIAAGSAAIDFVGTTADYPAEDIDSEGRTNGTLDAGADEL